MTGRMHPGSPGHLPPPHSPLLPRDDCRLCGELCVFLGSFIGWVHETGRVTDHEPQVGPVRR